MKKVLIILLCAAVILAAGGYLTYRFYIMPQYISPAVEKAADLINNEETKEMVDEIVSDLVENNVISEEEAEQYYPQDNENKEADNSEEKPEPESKPEPDKNNSKADSSAENKKSDNSRKNQSVYDKIKNNVSPGDAQEILSMYSKYSFLAGKSMEEIKKYAIENMSPGEIQRALQLYSKYSYLLN